MVATKESPSPRTRVRKEEPGTFCFKGTVKSLFGTGFVYYPPTARQLNEVVMPYDILIAGDHLFYVASAYELDDFNSILAEVADYQLKALIVEAKTGRIVASGVVW